MIPRESTAKVVYFDTVKANRWIGALYAALDVADQNNLILKSVEEVFE